MFKARLKILKSGGRGETTACIYKTRMTGKKPKLLLIHAANRCRAGMMPMQMDCIKKGASLFQVA